MIRCIDKCRTRYTHTHTNPRTHARTHARTHTRTHVCINIYIYIFNTLLSYILHTYVGKNTYVEFIKCNHVLCTYIVLHSCIGSCLISPWFLGFHHISSPTSAAVLQDKLQGLWPNHSADIQSARVFGADGPPARCVRCLVKPPFTTVIAMAIGEITGDFCGILHSRNGTRSLSQLVKGRNYTYHPYKPIR